MQKTVTVLGVAPRIKSFNLEWKLFCPRFKRHTNAFNDKHLICNRQLFSYLFTPKNSGHSTMRPSLLSIIMHILGNAIFEGSIYTYCNFYIFSKINETLKRNNNIYMFVAKRKWHPCVFLFLMHCFELDVLVSWRRCYGYMPLQKTPNDICSTFWVQKNALQWRQI